MGHAQPIQQAPGHPRFPCVTLSTNKQMKVKAVYKKKISKNIINSLKQGKKTSDKSTYFMTVFMINATKVEQCVC